MNEALAPSGHARLLSAAAGAPATLQVVASARDAWAAWEELRRLSSLPAVAALGAPHGFRVEDLSHVAVRAPLDFDAVAWLRRRVPAECEVRVEQEAAGEVWFQALFDARGARGLTQRAHYQREPDGKIRLEALELHATEHCNLRCEHCCNMSPYLGEHTLSAEEIGRTCVELARFVRADVFKISGGEPLLHPDITGVLRAARASGISPQVRLFTNGLLLGRMDEAFWQSLDQLTVSVYASAPLKAAQLAEIRAKARAFDVVLNIKPVDVFSEVMTARHESDPQAVARTYRSCWLRHRCMVVRRGVFFTCTRAAYQDDFAATFLHAPLPRPAAADGVPVGVADFGARLLAYLNQGSPLQACSHCLGSDGQASAHAQLSRADVQASRLRRQGPTP